MQPDITSLTNPRVKNTVRLKESKVRRRENMFLIDGVREVVRARAAGCLLIEIFVPVNIFESDESRHHTELLDFLQTVQKDRVPVWTVSEPVFEKLSFGDRNEGIMAVARGVEHSFGQFEKSLPANPLIGVIEGIEKPGNVGAVYRSADGAGLDGIILASPGTDFYNPNTIRASLGTLFRIPTVIASTTETIEWLFDHHLQIAAALCDSAAPYTEVDYTVGTAIVLGSEADGLTPVWSKDVIKRGGHPVKLPMLGIADSLNISTAAAVLFYEARRQRR